MALKLKITGDSGSYEIVVSNEQPTWSDLLNVISDKVGYAPETFQVKAGFPPKLVSAEPDTLLNELDIRNNDRLHIIQNTSNKQNINKSSTTNSTKKQTYITINSGYVIRRDVPDDNSCLFRAFYVLKKNTQLANQLRKDVVTMISRDSINYNEAILGKPVSEYCDLILKESTWGGAIELKALSEVYQTEICSIDIQTLRADRFGHGQYSQKVYVLYSGIHYDAVALSPDIELIDNQDVDLTIFNQNDKEIHDGVTKLAELYQKERAFTDMANFTLKCEVCKIGLRGQKEAQAHAIQSGHSSFSEY